MAQHNRRDFIKASALAGMGYWVAGGAQAKESTSPNERLRFGCIGVGGKGTQDTADVVKHADIVAMCDIDDGALEKAIATHGKAKKYNDFRKLIDDSKDIDAVTITIPDHNHAAAAILAMRAKKHTFCQKPLTHSIYEARRMAEIAKETGVATEMGNQYTADPLLREAAAVVESGVLGKIKEVHVYTNRPIWPQGGDRPAPSPVPPGVHWDLWLGTAKERPYANGYHPFKWRGYWDFGTGALGDMACHTANMPYMALGLKNPTSVVAETSGHNGETYPNWSKITFEFPATEHRPGLKLHWYDGGKRPPRELWEGRTTKENPKEEVSGCFVVGSKGRLYAAGDYCENPLDLFGLEKPKVNFKKSPGHFDEFIRAIRGGEPATSNFPGYASGLTETILLGNLAVWAAKDEAVPGKKIEWDAKNLVATNAPELMQIVKPEFRKEYRGIFS